MSVVVVIAAALALAGCKAGAGAEEGDPTGAAPTSTETSSPAPASSSSAAPSSTQSSVAPPLPTTTTPKPPSTPTPPAAGGWPGPDNTGWAHTGVKLAPLPCKGGEYLIDKAGTVIDGKQIPCSVRVTANDVKITRSQVRATGQWGVYLVDKFTRLTVQDVEIIGSDDCEYGVGYGGVTSVRINISGCSDGVKMDTGASLVDSWIHDLSKGPGDHNDGIQITGGSNITIRHNRIENPKNQTSAILVGGEFGSPSNILIANNFLNGGNYTIYLDPKGTNRVIRDNVFTKGFVYGPARLDGQVEWVNNTYEDGSAVKN
ncbi:right-handed parallel beta-helix repeat-containing protein [Lentzea sp. NPDC042327]|uniref:right-handed parallel beta-helix repeat-containing protein n=1 Tax=Lentzea sp. NPDC042327 TaxID=3154801 RepID=UPI0033D8616B